MFSKHTTYIVITSPGDDPGTLEKINATAPVCIRFRLAIHSKGRFILRLSTQLNAPVKRSVCVVDKWFSRPVVGLNSTSYRMNDKLRFFIIQGTVTKSTCQGRLATVGLKRSAHVHRVLSGRHELRQHSEGTRLKSGGTTFLRP
ncbi:unnamed protein product [Protopolystoma xenopodis]|uniref:Uncharacterized protein n=1 Tax=Protopolystoma xenopodis TaxID=117903 RepID=A0A3S5CII9_9PLAT|nr:unnamed protein product [Protopolystoma xenopodis]